MAGVVGLVGYGATSHSLAYASRERAPERAYALAPWDGRVGGVLATKLAGPEARAGDRVQADRLARKALLRDPTTVAAVATLGLDAQVRRDDAGARRLFAYARALSRRDLRTQLWAVEDSVSRGDIPAALKNYDIALRTSRIASDLMFPVLASAIDEPSIRSALVKTLADAPPWSVNFTDYVASNGPNVKATSLLFQSLRRAGVPTSSGAQAKLIGSLIQSKLFEDAWTYYALLHPGADRGMSRDARFAATGDTPSPFDWVPINDGGISASIQRGRNGSGVFDFAAGASVGGALLSQMQMLPAGRYVLEGHSEGVDQPQGSLPYWVLNCSDGHELGRVVMPNSAQAHGVFVGRFDVPERCPTQTLWLIARPSDQVSGISGQVDRLLLHPAR